MWSAKNDDHFRIETWLSFNKDGAGRVNVSVHYGSTPPRDRLTMVVDLADPASEPIVEALRTLAQFYLGGELVETDEIEGVAV